MNKIHLISYKSLAARPDLIPIYAKWIAFKLAFKNSVISDFTAHKQRIYNRLKQHGISRNSIRTWIDKFVEHGLATRDGNNIILAAKFNVALGDSKKATKSHRWITLEQGVDYKQQLYAILLKTKIDQTNFAIVANQFSGKHNEKINCLVKKMVRCKPVSMGSKQIAEIFQKSRTQGLRIANDLIKKKYFKKEVSKTSFVRHCSFKEWYYSPSEIKTEHFYYKGSVYFHPFNKYRIGKRLMQA